MGLKRAMMIGLDSADPVQVRRLMDEGKMPNLKKLLEEYGVANHNLAMLGALPSVTPPNWCSIATGNLPRTHGVTCYNNATIGSLGMEEFNWTSANVTSDFIWEQFAKEGKRSIMLSYCEAWPPRMTENDLTVMIDGSGVVPFLRASIDYQKVVRLEEGDFQMQFIPHAMKTDNTDCIIMGDQYDDLVSKAKSGQTNEAIPWAVPEGIVAYPAMVEEPFITGHNEEMEEAYRPTKADQIKSPLKTPTNWSFELPEGAKEAAVVLNNGMARRFLVISASDGVTYDTVTVYKNKKTAEPMGSVTGIGWSEMIYDYYIKGEEEHKVGYKINLRDIAADGSSAIVYFSHVSDLDNLDYFYPQEMGKKLYEAIGPYMQFASVDIRGDHKENDQLVFETYAKQGCEWFADAAHWLFKEYPDWQLFYTHIHSIDNFQHWFVNDTVPGTNPEYQYYRDLLAAVYTENDKFIGEMMKYLDEDTSIIVTSDHGCMPKSAGDHYGGVGSIGGISTGMMSKLGYTVLKYDDEGKLVYNAFGSPEIDWSKTRAIAHRSSYIWVNLKGRDPQGIVEPEDYHQLVLDIISDIYNYRNEDGKRVVAHAFTRDEMEYLGMGGIHCGDILLQLVPTFNNEHANVFSTVHHEGWSMQNLCIMGGGAFKQGEYIDRPIRITDIVPTLCHITDTGMPGNVEGGVIYQALKGFNETKYDRGDEWALPIGKRLIK